MHRAIASGTSRCSRGAAARIPWIRLTQFCRSFLQASLAQLNAELAAAGRQPLRQGIGLHFGEVMAGNLGSSQRLEFTVIGMSVIVASRLERLTRRFPDTPILISGALLALLPDRLQVLPLGSHRLKGLPDPVDVYGLLGLT